MSGQPAISAGPRDRLLDSAVDLLHGHAYSAVGVQALCEVAGVRKGSFYHFFASKEHLTVAALDRAWDRFRARIIEPALANEPTPEARDAAIRRACLDPPDGDHDASLTGCIFTRLAASVTNDEPMLKGRLAAILTDWADLLGGGDEGWAALAGIQGQLLLGFVVRTPDPVQA